MVSLERKARNAINAAVARCYNPKDAKYDHYGARGIEVYQPWIDDRSSFVSWALSNGINSDLTLDRQDNNLGYTPENCRWVSPKINTDNRSVSLSITIGTETKSKSDWFRDSRVTIGYGTFYKRRAKGWSYEKALFTPPDLRFSRKKSAD